MGEFLTQQCEGPEGWSCAFRPFTGRCQRVDSPSTAGGTNLPVWSPQLIELVVQAEKKPEGERDAELQALWEALPFCSNDCMNQDAKLGQGAFGAVHHVGGLVYKEHQTLPSPESDSWGAPPSVALRHHHQRGKWRWFELVVEALIQTLIHQAVPFATPYAGVCKARKCDDSAVEDKRVFLVTTPLDNTLSGTCGRLLAECSRLELLDFVAQLIMIDIGISASGMKFYHNDIHKGNIMYKLEEKPVTLSAGGVTYRSPTRRHWMLIDFGLACLEDAARSIFLYADQDMGRGGCEDYGINMRTYVVGVVLQEIWPHNKTPEDIRKQIAAASRDDATTLIPLLRSIEREMAHAK